MEQRENNWFEHWIVVGSVSAEAHSMIHSVDGRVEDIHPLTGPHLVMVCLLYDEAEGDRDINVHLDGSGKTLRIDVTCPGNPRGAQLVIHSSFGALSIVQESVENLVMVTEAEWFEIDSTL